MFMTPTHKIFRKENKKIILFHVGCVLFFLPFFILHGFNFPSSDDFSYTVDSIEKGFIQSQIDVYKNWCGRFIPTALNSFNPLVWHRLDLYKLCSLLNMLFLLFSFHSLTKTITDLLDIKKYQWPGFMLFSILVFAHWPGPSEGFYWLSGYTTYTIPVSVLLFGLSWYLRWETKNAYNPLKIFLLVSVAFIVVGFQRVSYAATLSLLFFCHGFCLFQIKEEIFQTPDFSDNLMPGGIGGDRSPRQYCAKDKLSPGKPSLCFR